MVFRDPSAEVQPLRLDPGVLGELERRLVLVYTGASRFSGNTITRVMEAYGRGERRDTAEWMAEALVAGDLGQVGTLLDDNWRLQQALDPVMCTPLMERLGAAMRAAGALGGKAAGSGAGGSMFFLGPDDPEPLRQAARSMGVRLLPVRWSAEGVHPC
jgi:D-glycero-alpha-D-manno-heptose-7-phosphate kinase